MQRKPKLWYVLIALAIAAVPTAGVFADVDLTGPVASLSTATPNPAALGDLVTVTATVDDTATGGSNILSAEFSVNGGTFTAMTAVDGTFDSPTEAVTGSFTADLQGGSVICVQGTDVLLNVGSPECIDLTTNSLYGFDGFKPPIKNDGNTARAGRTVPVKWMLSLADGTPVNDLTVFAGLMSYEVDCTTLVGDPATAVSEPGPGKAAVRANENGKWRALWKTSKSYGGTCRMLFVSFSDGSTSPEVLFRFR